MGRRMCQPRLDLARLLRRSGLDEAVSIRPTSNAEYSYEVLAPNTIMAELVGRPRDVICRWQREGGIPLRAAEDCCDALGLHPVEVWGDDWIDAVEAYGEALSATRARLLGLDPNPPPGAPQRPRAAHK